jgi:hypothetical protein
MSRSNEGCCGAGEEATPESPALEISKERFVGGEIDKAEFEEKRKNLSELPSAKFLALSKDDCCWLAFN